MKQLFLLLAFVVAGIAPAMAQSTIVAGNNETIDENAPLKYEIKNGEVWTESGGISFARNSAAILPESKRTLNTIKKYLQDKTYISTLRIEGHTDCGKGAQELSEARAIAVCEWLVANGVDCKRLLPVGFGCNKPIADVSVSNARITFVNAALRDRAIGGMPLDGGGKVAGDACR